MRIPTGTHGPCKTEEMHASEFAAEGLVASAALHESVGLNMGVGTADPFSFAESKLSMALADGDFRWVTQETWWSSTPWGTVREFVEKSIGPLEFHVVGEESALYAENDQIAVVVALKWGDTFKVTIACAYEEKTKEWTAAFAELFPARVYDPPPPLPSNVVPVSFWMQDRHEGSAFAKRRNITVHEWENVEANYPAATRKELATLMALDAPKGGKLMTFHGMPGVGKTRAILTLISEWRDWCSASVVTDAEKFFGDATYLNSIIFGSEGMRDFLLLIIEDGDEFMNVDGRDSKGQSIARLLNVADGIIGQGLNLLTLISTNVAVDQLNPAITRSGRSMANVGFDLFEAEEANAWCAAREVETAFAEAVSLADMYRALEV